MFEELKNQLQEIIDVAELCPERYREKCFSILLEHWLSSYENPKMPPGKPLEAKNTILAGGSRDLFSQFVKEHDLNGTLSQVFHLEDSKCGIIVNDLKTPKKAQRQVRLGLLVGVKHIVEEGVPNIPDQELRDLCTTYAAYDESNFASYMKKQKHLFVKTDTGWKLTKPGEKEAANLIKELGKATESK